MPFTDTQLDQHIRRRPSVQKICLGAYLQQPMFVAPDILAVPLSSVGYGDMVKLVADYLSADLKLSISEKEVAELVEGGKQAYPGVALVWHPVRDATSDELLRSCELSFRRAQRLLSVVTGDKTDIVANVILHTDSHKYDLLPTKSRNRQRLWFLQSDAVAFERDVVRLAEISESDSRVSLALQLYLDARNDRSDEFRLVKLYNVLECLASTHKKNGVGSRDAIREMLGIAPGPTFRIEYKGTPIDFDLISVAGRVRDKLMHGARIDGDTFAVNNRGALEVLAYEPFKLADKLLQTVDDYFHQLSRQ